MKNVSGVRVSFAMAIVALVALSVSSTASAQVVVGQTAPSTSLTSSCEFEAPYDELQTSVSSGTSYAVPTAGVLTSWSTNAREGSGQILELKVFRPAGPPAYTVLAHDVPRALTPSTLNTFPINIPVQAGDIVGLHVPTAAVPTACVFATTSETDQIGFKEGDALDGSAFSIAPLENGVKSRLNVSATLLPPPAVSGIGPAKGSVKGGQSIVITGANFASVGAVTFGTAAAESFTVNSEGQITAAAPPSKTLSKVPVSVTTIAGAASSVQTFAYEGCNVPKLSSQKLKASKRKSKKADCKIGSVKKRGDATAKTGKVVKQNPKPGKILAPGTKISVTLGA